MYPAFYDPAQRGRQVRRNIAQYLVDCHDTPGVTLQLLRGHDVWPRPLPGAEGTPRGRSPPPVRTTRRQPKLYDASVARMSMKPDGYAKDASADDATVFHGREVRKVSAARTAPASTMFIHLCRGQGRHREGWSAEEIEEHSGWMSDRGGGGRWRDGGVCAAEAGADWYRAKFGPEAFGLHHRFYLHLDGGDNFWLSAEDGCEGVAQSKQKPAFDFGGPGAREPLFHLQVRARRVLLYPSLSGTCNRITNI